MTDDSKATPRPWWAEDDGTLRHGNGVSFVKLISPWIEQAWNGDAEAIANSHLIAAAVNAHDDLTAERDALRDELHWFRVEYQDEIGIEGIKVERDAVIAERDRLRQALVEARDALDETEAVMSIVPPRNSKADYLCCLENVRAALARIREALGDG